MTGDVLDYDVLLARYQSNLVNTLRNFGFAADYLDLWVPDEDLSRSLLNLLDAAATAGRTSLGIRLPAAAWPVLDAAQFRGELAARGRVRIERKPGSVMLHADGLQSPQSSPSPMDGTATKRAAAADAPAGHKQRIPDAPLRQPETIASPYDRNLEMLVSAPWPSPAPPDGAVQASAEVDGLTLDAWIDPHDHLIGAMTCRGARTAVAERLMGALARVCQGLPILEAADHGVIRLECRLRDEHAPRPLPGVVIPEAADPAFAVVARLLRALLADYRRRSGYSETANTFDPLPGAEWTQAEDGKRRRMLEAAIRLGRFASAGVNIVAIEHDVRVVISIDGDQAPIHAPSMLELERRIKRLVDGRLEVFLTEIKDSNKLRRREDRA
jgi:hypothetical protein